MTEQLRLFETVEDKKIVSSTKAVEDAKMLAIQRYLEKGKSEPLACIGTYSPNGRRTQYFRLCYRQNKKVKCIHIPGGNVLSKLAQYRAIQLQKMIDRGAELGEIIAAVQTYCSGME